MDWISSALFQFFSLVLVLGVVVTVHEFGHFLAARIVGVRVEVFSLGFGSRIFGFRRGATEYRVSWIPLGGYVRMAGEGSLEGPATGAPDEFESRRAWEKLFILGAGPLANILLAIGLYSVAFYVGFPVPAFFDEPPRVAAVVPGSPAEAAGLTEGDRILSLDDRSQESWQTLEQALLLRPNQTVRLGVERSGRSFETELTLEARGKHRIGWSGIQPWCELTLAEVVKGSPAEAAGLQPGDVIERLDGDRTCSAGQLAAALKKSRDQPRTLTVLRGEERSEVSFAPLWNEEREAWMIGIAAQPVPSILQRRGAAAALSAGVRETWSASTLIFDTLGRLVTGRLSLRAMSGPGEIADVASVAVQLGPLTFVRLLAIISINLGLLNLLPIPVLDGGRMAVVGFEAVRGRELGDVTKEWILRAGLAMIVALMFVVLFFDVLKKLED